MLPDRRVGFVDFGLCDKLDETVRANQLSYVSAIYAGNQPRIFKALTEVLVARPESDVEGLRRDFDAEMRGGDHEHGGASSTANALIGVLRVARRNGYQIPSDVLSLYRALVTVETLASELGLPNGLRDVGGRFFAELRRDEKFDQLSRSRSAAADAAEHPDPDPGRAGPAGPDPGRRRRWQRAPARGVHGRRPGSSGPRTGGRGFGRRPYLAVSVAVLLTIPNLPVVLGVPLEWPLGAGLGGLYLACAVPLASTLDRERNVEFVFNAIGRIKRREPSEGSSGTSTPRCTSWSSCCARPSAAGSPRGWARRCRTWPNMDRTSNGALSPGSN